MNSHLGKETADERALFEQAKAKLEEAFTLLQSLEGRMQSNVGRSPIDAAQRAEERDRLLAYVEHAQSEALRLARRSRRLSRIRVRAKAQANVQRAPSSADQTSVPEGAIVTELSAALAAAPSEASGGSTIITEPAPALTAPLLAAATTRDLEHSDIDDEDLSNVEFDGTVIGEMDSIERAFETATRELSGRLSVQKTLTPERIARSRADTLIGRFADLKDEDLEISDDELKAFEDAMAVATAQHTRIEWWPAAAEGAEQEKAGARMRRDRTPTERMERATVRPALALTRRYLSVRNTVIVVATATLLVIVGVTVRATRTAPVEAIAVLDVPAPFIGPPSELAMPYMVDETATSAKQPKARLARDSRHRPRR